MFEKSMQEINELYKKGEREMIRMAGGDNKWKALSPVVQAEKYAHMLEKVVADLGKEAFEMLSDHEKRILRLFIWAGCGCHKDLNTVRGGYTAMSQWWEANGCEGPILLANRDNDPVLQEQETAIELGDTTTLAQDRAFEKTTRGAIKATQIAGALFNNKDDKKGHHDIFRYWWAEHIGIPFTFPDTSNNRFQSYCDAAAALILYLGEFLQFLEHLRQNKQSSKLNHMETNLWKALHCKATLAELAVLSLYAEAVSYPYMKAIRISVDKQENMLDLGPLHKRVANHIQKIINDPSILLSENPSSTTGSLDGSEWQNPAVIKKVHTLQLLYLKDLLVAFFKGSKDTWERFTSEFAPGGLIDEATAEEKELAWMPATNDENEGSLGSFRRLMRQQPQLTLLGHNAMAMFFKNDTESFMAAKFTEKEDYQFLHKLGRESQGLEKERKKELVKFRDERQAKKTARQEARQKKAQENAARIAGIAIILDKRIVSALKGNALNDQIRVFQKAGAPNLEQKLPKKADDKRKALESAVEMYEKGEWKIDGGDLSDAWEPSGEEEFDFGGIDSEESENE